MPILEAVARPGQLWILGASPREGSMAVPMKTNRVTAVFPQVSAVDPRFEVTDEDKKIFKASFQDVSFAGCDTYFSDMYMPPLTMNEKEKALWRNNGLKEEIDKYVKENLDRDHRRFVLVHKMTWSTTSFSHLAEQLARSRDYQMVRIRASGRSSERFLVVNGLGRPVVNRRIVTCCSTAKKVSDLWAHAERCDDCALGRILPAGSPGISEAFRPAVRQQVVRVNCAKEKGATYRVALEAYKETGKIYGTTINHTQGRTEKRFKAILGQRSKAAKGKGGGGAEVGTVPGSQLDIPVMTRNDRPDLVVATVDTEARKYLDENPGFKEYLQTWMHDPWCGLREVERLTLLPEAKVKPLKSTYDTFRGLVEALSPAAAPCDVTSWNELSGQLRGAFSAGKMFIDQVVMPVNTRRHPISLMENFRAMGPGLGLHYSAKKPAQTLAVLETRYLNKRQNYPFDQKAKTLAKEIVDAWWDEHVRPGACRVDTLTDADLDLALDALLKDARSKGYAERFVGSGGWDSPEGRIVRFHLKSIFKPKLAPDLYKVGQGISAWSVQSLAMFCNAFRALTTMSVRVEKDYVVTDSYWTDGQFIKYLNTVFRTVPAAASFGVTDGEMFDGCQNQFTQETERCYLRRAGVAEDFISLYYSFRVDYLILSSCATGRAGTQKTSGEPGTLFNNGVISRCISNWLLRGIGPQVIIYKGDDFVKYQCGLEARMDKKEWLDEVCALKIRINISRGADFCGLILEDGRMFPSIIRKANKVVAHRFRSYEHFAEYQESPRLDEKCRRLRRGGGHGMQREAVQDAVYAGRDALRRDQVGLPAVCREPAAVRVGFPLEGRAICAPKKGPGDGTGFPRVLTLCSGGVRPGRTHAPGTWYSFKKRRSRRRGSEETHTRAREPLTSRE